MTEIFLIAAVVVGVLGLAGVAIGYRAQHLCEAARPMIERAHMEARRGYLEAAEQSLARANERIDAADRLLHPWRMLPGARGSGWLRRPPRS